MSEQKSTHRNNNIATALTLGISGCGLLTSFLASSQLSVRLFGWYTVVGSQVAFWSSFCSLGFLGYYLGHIKDYKNSEYNIFLLPIALSTVVGFIYTALSHSSENALAFSIFLMVSVSSGAFVVHAQINKEPVSIAMYQGIPTLLKSMAVAIFIIASNFSENVSIENTDEALFANVFTCLSIAILAALFKIKQKKISSTSQTHGIFNLLNDPKFYASWLGVVAAFSFATAIPSLVAKKTNIETAAYFGIYILFWSTTSTLSTAIVTNRYGYQLAHALNSEDVAGAISVLTQSAKRAVGIAAIATGGTLVTALMMAEIIWPKFQDISAFLRISALLLTLKCLQSWAGMLLAMPNYVIARTATQLGCITLFITTLYFLQSPSAFDILYCLIAAELLLTIIFLLHLHAIIRKLRTGEIFL